MQQTETETQPIMHDAENKPHWFLQKAQTCKEMDTVTLLISTEKTEAQFLSV